MDLQFVKGSYMDEIKLGDRHVLFTLEGLDEGQEKEANEYSEKVWNWILQHHSQVLAHAGLIASFKNKKWHVDGAPEVSPEEMREYLNQINSVYVTYEGGFDVFFDTSAIFQERSIVVSVSKNFAFEGFKLL